MPAIYPSTALKNQQREIKSIADAEIVYITENGRGKYVFMSEDVLQKQIDEAGRRGSLRTAPRGCPS